MSDLLYATSAEKWNPEFWEKFLFETRQFRCKNLQKPIKTLCFGHFQFDTRRAQLSLSAVSWQSTICSAACTRCPLCPFQIGLGVPVFDSFAVSGAPPPVFPEGHVLWHIICCSFPQCSVLERTNAVINTKVTRHCARRPRNRSCPGGKALRWTENRKEMYR